MKGVFRSTLLHACHVKKVKIHHGFSFFWLVAFVRILAYATYQLSIKFPYHPVVNQLHCHTIFASIITRPQYHEHLSVYKIPLLLQPIDIASCKRSVMQFWKFQAIVCSFYWVISYPRSSIIFWSEAADHTTGFKGQGMKMDEVSAGSEEWRAKRVVFHVDPSVSWGEDRLVLMSIAKSTDKGHHRLSFASVAKKSVSDKSPRKMKNHTQRQEQQNMFQQRAQFTPIFHSHWKRERTKRLRCSVSFREYAVSRRCCYRGVWCVGVCVRFVTEYRSSTVRQRKPITVANQAVILVAGPNVAPIGWREEIDDEYRLFSNPFYRGIASVSGHRPSTKIS